MEWHPDPIAGVEMMEMIAEPVVPHCNPSANTKATNILLHIPEGMSCTAGLAWSILEGVQKCSAETAASLEPSSMEGTKEKKD